MWAFLVLISGGLFYAWGSVLNAKALPDPTTVSSQTSADSMFLLHQLAKSAKQSGAWSASNDFDYSTAQSSGYKNPNWRSKKVGTSCILTVKTLSADISDPQKMTAGLGRYAKDPRAVGYIDANRVVIAWSSDIYKPSPPGDVKNTPYIYECNL